MIYKLSLAAAAVAALAALNVAGNYQGASRQEAHQLEQGQKELEMLSKKEKKASEWLEELHKSCGDISEESCKALEQDVQAKQAELEAARTEFSELIESRNADINELRSLISAQNNENMSLNRELGRLKNQAVRLGISIEPERNVKEKPFTHEELSKLIAARLNFVHAARISRDELMGIFENSFHDAAARQRVTARELSNKLFNEKSRYPARAIKLKAVGVHPDRPIVEMTLAFVYKGLKKRYSAVPDKSGYIHATYELNNAGKVISMREVESAEEPSLSAGLTPYQYTGADTAVEE